MASTVMAETSGIKFNHSNNYGSVAQMNNCSNTVGCENINEIF